MKKHIPNTLTCCNLLCGCFAVIAALAASYEIALAFIVCGAVFDFFDGFAARLLHVSSPIGKELDSLADNITFGLAPAVIVFSLMDACVGACCDGGGTTRALLFGTKCHILFGTPVTAGCCPGTSVLDSTTGALLSLTPFLISAFSALRLAKFNLDERQTTSFIGLPTPANALFWAAAAVGLSKGVIPVPSPALLFLCLLAGTLLSCFLLVSEIPMFALKFKTYGWRGNELRYSFAALCAVLLAVWGAVAFAPIIVLYILVSVASNLFRRK